MSEKYHLLLSKQTAQKNKKTNIVLFFWQSPSGV